MTRSSDSRSLLSAFPEVAAEWDYDANGGLTPDQITPGSKKNVGWKCKAYGHTWPASVDNRTKGRGCPVCGGKQVLAGFNDLASRYPEVAAEWDYDANKDLKPDQVTPGSNKPAHWRCKAHGHTWEVPISKRTQKKPQGCPYCSNQRVWTGFNDLASQVPEVAAEWDYEKNEELTPEAVVAGSNKKAYWKCLAHGHRWSAKISERTRGGTGCPVCSNNVVLPGFNDFQSQFPHLVQEWDFEANLEKLDLRPDQITPGSNKAVYWKCRNHGHQWKTQVNKRTQNGSGCPFCSGRRVLAGFNDLESRRPGIAAEWDRENNKDLRPDQVTVSSNHKVHWKGSCGHSWRAIIATRTNGNDGCPVCQNQQILPGYNDLKTHYPVVAAEWDYEENNGRGPEQFSPGSSEMIHWKCQKAGHQWETVIVSRTHGGTGCPYCSGRLALRGVNDLATTRPDLVAEWDFEENKGRTPAEVAAGSDFEADWVCPNGHKYKMKVQWRTRAVRPLGCHCQGRYWNARRLEGFVADLAMYTDSMTPAMLYAVCQQAGVLTSSKADVIGKVLTDPTRLKDLVAEPDTGTPQGEGSDALPENDVTPSDAEDELDALDPEGHLPTAAEVIDAASGSADLPAADQRSDSSVLPELRVEDILSMGKKFFANADEDTVDFLSAAAAAQIWKIAYRLDADTVTVEERSRLVAELDKTRTPCADQYSELIRVRFRAEYDQALELVPPAGWSFIPPGATETVQPNLMQRHVAVQVLNRRRVGNWSGTGAGKTVSAILAAGLLDAGTDGGLVLVVCPNNVVSGWVNSVENCFPHAQVAQRTLTPTWANEQGPRWLIVNYDRLPGNQGTLKQLIADHRIDMLVVDEVHYVKERENVNPSQRRTVLAGVAVEAARSNPHLAVLAMSATPVVNDLHEARSLLELVEGMQLDDLGTARSVPNAMRIHQYLTRVGSRWLPSYRAQLDATTVSLDVTHRIDDIIALGRSPVPSALDQLLVEDKLDVIVDHCSTTGKTLIYTQFVTGIIEQITGTLEAAGFRVGLFTGQDKSGYARFIGRWPNGDRIPDDEQVDVLIGSEAISTGVDGLQHVCDTLIFATLPWTHANYQQIVGRIHRQGQAARTVKVVIPTTYADVPTADGTERWSWCGQRWARVEMKESLADCAVDGVVPKGVLVSPTEAARASLEWLRRLRNNQIQTASRRPLDQLLGADVDRMTPTAKFRRFSELSTVHGAWATTSSVVTHTRLTEDPAEWHRYHALYREARKKWEVVPAYEFARWLNERKRPCVVADMGCGEMLLAERVTADHTILPFDHVAFDARVTACDIADLPLDDASVDIAVLSLALMGKNHPDYLREAHRILPVDGHLWLCEPTSSVGSDVGRLRAVVASYGFELFRVQTRGQFTFVRALKSDSDPQGAGLPVKLTGHES